MLTQTRNPEITTTAAEAAVRILLHAIGEEPDRDGLQDTPARFLKMLHEVTSGSEQDPREILSRTFEEPCDEMVILKSIAFNSTCEHHLLNFSGTVAIGYLPGKVVGISKLARLVECYARRLQIQERLTQQIARDIEEHLEARGVGVVVRAHHSCMGCRGVMQGSAEMVTSAMRGILLHSSQARSEFLNLIQK